jgi:hypothetical protein
MAKPKPVIVERVCSLCGEDWDAHGDNPTAEDCVKLLKAKLALQPVMVRERVYPHTVPIYPSPNWWQSTPTITCTSGTTTNGYETFTPRNVEVSAA